MTDGTVGTASSARALLRERDYIIFLISRAIGVLGTVVQTVTMGWQVYDLARVTEGVAESALYVGILGFGHSSVWASGISDSASP